MKSNKLVGIQFQNGITGLFFMSAIAIAIWESFGSKHGAAISVMSTDTSVEFGNLTVNNGQDTHLAMSDDHESVLNLLNADNGNSQARIKYVPVVFADGTVAYFETGDIPSAALFGKTRGMENIILSSDLPFQAGALSKSSAPYKAINVQNISSTEKSVHGHGTGHVQQNSGQPALA